MHALNALPSRWQTNVTPPPPAGKPERARGVTSASCDVLIAGGGLIGDSLAVALAPLGLRIVVVEAQLPTSAAQPSYDDRSTAISEGSRRILSAIGAWSRVGNHMGQEGIW